MFALLLLSLSACDMGGCGIGPGPDPASASLLESFRVDAASPLAAGSYSGTLNVQSSAAGDMSLGFDDGSIGTLAVHSPAHDDLGALAGADVTLSVATDDFYGATALAISDDAGLAWLAEPLGGTLLAPSFFGADFAEYGSSLATTTDGDYILDVQTVLFAGDDETVEVAPGNSAPVTVGGITYIATVIASYTAELAPGVEPTDCGGRVDMLSYELQRVSAPESRDLLVRPADLPAAGAGCGGLQ